jgi:hypothetical protein
MSAFRPETDQAAASMTAPPSNAAAGTRRSFIRDENAAHPGPISAPC